MRARCGLTWLCVMVVLTAAGCQLTPHQQLIGRWSNADMSIRFREDGRFLMFSRSGRFEGRYEFYGPNPASRAATENLVVDVAQNGKVARMLLDADFLGTDRLRITDLTPRTQRTIDPAPDFALLRRSLDAPATEARR